MNISEFESEFRRKIIAGGGDYATAKVYGNCISVFMKYFENKYDTPLKITSRDMEDYIIHMREQKHSSSYINQFIASAKRFYRILGQPKKCDVLIYHKRNQKTPNILTFNECMKMCNSKVYLKHQVIINILYYAALRRSELLNLKVDDISLNGRLTIIDSKFGKSRVVPIPQNLLNLILRYIEDFKPNIYLLNSDKGFGMYSAKSVENVIKNVAKLCGIDKRVYPHIMRSSRATHLLDSGASDMYVSQMLGHEKLQTTKDFYCKLTIQGMQNNLENANQKLIENEANNNFNFINSNNNFLPQNNSSQRV